MLFVALNSLIEKLTKEFEVIPADRKGMLNQLTRFVQSKVETGEKIYLNFICTHNSRRSHIAQLWAQAAAYHYGVPNLFCFSGGTEATALNPRAVNAMQEAGFTIIRKEEGDNPVYDVRFSDPGTPIIAFSKKV